METLPRKFESEFFRRQLQPRYPLLFFHLPKMIIQGRISIILLQCRLSEMGDLAWLSITCEITGIQVHGDAYSTGSLVGMQLSEDSIDFVLVLGLLMIQRSPVSIS